MGKVITKESLSSRVYQDLKNAIVNSEFSPGQFLHEEFLAEVTGASRTPIREALLHLQRDGLIELVPRKGARVWKFENRLVRELVEMQILYETPFFDLQHLSDHAALRFRELHLGMQNLSEEIKEIDPGTSHWQEKRLESAELGFDFHRSLVIYQENRCLLDAYDLMMSKIRMYFNWKLLNDSRFFQASSADHQQTADAILKGKIQKAKSFHIKHLSRIFSVN